MTTIPCKHIQADELGQFATLTLSNVPEKAGPSFHQTNVQWLLCAFCTGVTFARVQTALDDASKAGKAAP